MRNKKFVYTEGISNLIIPISFLLRACLYQPCLNTELTVTANTGTKRPTLQLARAVSVNYSKCLNSHKNP